jgi:hypothetical protein
MRILHDILLLKGKLTSLNLRVLLIVSIFITMIDFKETDGGTAIITKKVELGTFHQLDLTSLCRGHRIRGFIVKVVVHGLLSLLVVFFWDFCDDFVFTLLLFTEFVICDRIFQRS